MVGAPSVARDRLDGAIGLVLLREVRELDLDAQAADRSAPRTPSIAGDVDRADAAPAAASVPTYSRPSRPRAPVTIATWPSSANISGERLIPHLVIFQLFEVC